MESAGDGTMGQSCGCGCAAKAGPPGVGLAEYTPHQIMTGTIAHEMNNVLCVQSGTLSELEERLRSREPSDDLLVELRVTVDRLSTLTRRLVSISRPCQQEAQEVDLHKVLRELERSLSLAIGAETRVSSEMRKGRCVCLAPLGLLEELFLLACRALMPSDSKVTRVELALRPLDGGEAPDFGFQPPAQTNLVVVQVCVSWTGPLEWPPRVGALVERLAGHQRVDLQDGLGWRWRVAVPCRVCDQP
jgi:hypothetical protein